MAWIHPETNGDYKIIGVSLSTDVADQSAESYYTAVAQGDISGDMAAVLPASSWDYFGTTLNFDDIATKYGGFTGAIYNPNGDIVASSATDLFDGTITNAIGYNLNGTPVTAAVWTGSISSGVGQVYPFAEHGDSEAIFGNSSSTNDDWLYEMTDYYGYSKLFYVYTADSISTISGSISGTLSRENTEIWAVGSVTLTADVDFGGNIDVLEALDASQTPTMNFGLYKFNVGSGGTAPAGWATFSARVATADTGTNNTIEGEIGAAVLVGGVVYE